MKTERSEARPPQGCRRVCVAPAAAGRKCFPVPAQITQCLPERKDSFWWKHGISRHQVGVPLRWSYECLKTPPVAWLVCLPSDEFLSRFVFHIVPLHSCVALNSNASSPWERRGFLRSVQSFAVPRLFRDQYGFRLLYCERLHHPLIK